MGKMYFPDEMPSRRNSHKDQLRELQREIEELERVYEAQENEIERLEGQRWRVKKELRKVILIWVSAIVLIIVDIILFIHFL